MIYISKKRIIKYIIISIICVILILPFSIYMFFEGMPRLITTITCNRYIYKNYPNAEIINKKYETQIAFILIGGAYTATVREGNYEFDVNASNLFFSKASITDYYGSSPGQLSRYDEDNIIFQELTNFLTNHELFEKYGYRKSELSFYIDDEPGFVTKKKANKNTFEILRVSIESKFNSKNTDLINLTESEEKHKLLNDIKDFLESKNITVQQLELEFCFDETDEESNYIPDTSEKVVKYSDEFLKYKENKELMTDRNKNKNEYKRMIDFIKNKTLEGWTIEDVYVDEVYDDINIILKNQEDNENTKNNIRMFLNELNDLLIEENINNSILLHLESHAHKNNEKHYIIYNR